MGIAQCVLSRGLVLRGNDRTREFTSASAGFCSSRKHGDNRCRHSLRYCGLHKQFAHVLDPVTIRSETRVHAHRPTWRKNAHPDWMIQSLVMEPGVTKRQLNALAGAPLFCPAGSEKSLLLVEVRRSSSAIRERRPRLFL